MSILHDAVLLKEGNTCVRLRFANRTYGLDIDIRFRTRIRDGDAKRYERVVNFMIDDPNTEIVEGNGNDFGDNGYDATLLLLKKINDAAHANNYAVSKMFAWDTKGPFPSGLDRDSNGEARTAGRLCRSVELVLDNGYGGKCQTDESPHRHHIHLRFEPVGGSTYALDMDDSSTTITIPSGADEGSADIPIAVRDSLGGRAITYTLLNYKVVGNDGVLTASTLHNNRLYVNPDNTVAGVGTATLTLTCHQASTTPQLVQINTSASSAVGTITVNCAASQ